MFCIGDPVMLKKDRSKGTVVGKTTDFKFKVLLEKTSRQIEVPESCLEFHFAKQKGARKRCGYTLGQGLGDTTNPFCRWCFVKLSSREEASISKCADCDAAYCSIECRGLSYNAGHPFVCKTCIFYDEKVDENPYSIEKMTLDSLCDPERVGQNGTMDFHAIDATYLPETRGDVDWFKEENLRAAIHLLRPIDEATGRPSDGIGGVIACAHSKKASKTARWCVNASHPHPHRFPLFHVGFYKLFKCCELFETYHGTDLDRSFCFLSVHEDEVTICILVLKKGHPVYKTLMVREWSPVHGMGEVKHFRSGLFLYHEIEQLFIKNSSQFEGAYSCPKEAFHCKLTGELVRFKRVVGLDGWNSQTASVIHYNPQRRTMTLKLNGISRPLFDVPTDHVVKTCNRNFMLVYEPPMSVPTGAGASMLKARMTLHDISDQSSLLETWTGDQQDAWAIDFLIRNSRGNVYIQRTHENESGFCFLQRFGMNSEDSSSKRPISAPGFFARMAAYVLLSKEGKVLLGYDQPPPPPSRVQTVSEVAMAIEVATEVAV